MQVPRVQASRLKVQRPPGGLARTTETYDAIAEAYAEKFDLVELSTDRRAFVAQLPLPLVLDAGCGTGRDSRFFESDGLSVVGVDVSLGMLRAARKRTRAPLAAVDVRRLSFPNGIFGGVWCCAVLVHLEPDDFRRAATEFYRTLVLGGSLFVSVREGSGEELRPESDGLSRWFHLYDQGQAVQLLRDVGFAVTSAKTEPGIVGGTWVNLHATKAER